MARTGSNEQGPASTAATPAGGAPSSPAASGENKESPKPFKPAALLAHLKASGTGGDKLKLIEHGAASLPPDATNAALLKAVSGLGLPAGTMDKVNLFLAPKAPKE